MNLLPRHERPLHWVGSAKRDLLDFPSDVVSDFGYGLGVVQLGGLPPAAKPWKGEGLGVFELVDDYRGDTYRVAYTGALRERGVCAALFSEEVSVRDPYRQDRYRPDP